MKLNVGCGNIKMDGYVNIDISETCKPDVVADITKGLDYKDRTCSEVHAGCVIEQIADNDDFIFALNEIWRVLKPEGVFRGYVPSNHENVMFVDPMDKRFFRKETFDYFDGEKHHWKEFGKNYGFMPWRNIQITINEHGILHFSMQPMK